MKKKSELFFTFLKIPFDYLTLIFAGLLAYSLRYDPSVQRVRPVIFDLQFEKFIYVVLIIAAIWLIFFAWTGLYSFTRKKITDEIKRIFLACSTGMSGLIIYMFFVRDLFQSRFIVLSAWVLCILFITIERIIIRKVQNYTLANGWGAHNIITIGNDDNTQELIKTFKEQPELGYKVIATFTDFDERTKEQIETIRITNTIDEIVQGDYSFSRAKSIEMLDFANEHNIIFKYTAGQFEARTTNIEVHMLAGIPVVEIRKTKLDGWGKINKRIIDFIFSTILIIIFSPLMLLIAILIKLENRGPAIYKNERVSRDGQFNVYKFRSMYVKYCVGKQFEKYTDQKAVLEYEQELIKKQSERSGPVYKVLNDPRRTVIGRFIEKTSLDELPQLFNVWIGNMSLVGPRPHQAREVDKYAKHHKRVLDIKPGVTGLAQISGRSDLDFDEEVKLDTYYIENWSLALDFWIMLKTPFIVLTRK